MAVILGNAYKGDNFTKIISPLPPVPYTSFDQLVKHSFKIYTWTTQEFNFDISYLNVWQEYQNCDECYSKVGTHCYRSTMKLQNSTKPLKFRINSDLLSAFLYSSFSNFELKPNSYHCDFEMHLSSREQNMLNNTMIIPPEWKYYNAELNRVSLLQNCEANTKFALIQAEAKILNFKIAYNNPVTSSKFKGAVSFGQEILGSYANGFILKGWIPINVVKRMQGLYLSGMLGWHDQFWKKYNQEKGLLQDFVRNGEYQASNLKGSIKVVFTVFPFGFLAALLSFLIETWKCLELMRLYTRIRSGFKYIVLLVMNSKIVKHYSSQRRE